jgi:predicted phosphodiesterase
MDRGGVRRVLPSRTELEAAGHRIGVIHGHGVPGDVWLGGGRVDFELYNDYLLSQFDDVACIVYGHTHWPRVDRRRGVLLFNPGAACGQSPLGYGSVGVLTVTEDGIEGEIIRL